MPEISLEYPLWFIIFCIIAGLGYSWILYLKSGPWGNSTNRILSAIRFVIVSVLVFLLLNPLIKQILSVVEKPAVVVAIDNSQSILNSTDTIQISGVLSSINEIKDGLISEGYDVELRTLEKVVDKVDEIIYDQQVTNIDALLKDIQSSFEGRNLVGTVLLSDGKYNQGMSPTFFPYGFTVYSVGLGDTTRKEDLILKNVYYNKIAYQGNKFPIRVEVLNQGFLNSQSSVSIKQNGKTLQSKRINFTNDNSLSVIDFSIEAKEKGVQRYQVEVKVLQRESVIANNRKQLFIDVIEGKQKILLLAPAAHPDIKVLRAVIESNDNYEFDHFIPGMTELKTGKYDLVINHQAYDKFNRTSKYLKQFQDKKTPILYILGKQTNLVIMSRENVGFNFKMIRNQTDVVAPTYNDTYSKFNYNTDYNSLIKEFPPIKVPYGTFELTSDAEVLLFQKVGSITTNKPLVYTVEGIDSKAGYILGDGFWQWRMQEYALTESTAAFDELFLKLIQYLSTKEDKRKFKVFTAKSEYYDNETIQIQAELYNEIYERIYGNEVVLNITSENGFQQKYTFTTSTSNSALKLSGLKEGIYTYQATTSRGSKRESASGRFTVRKLQLELLDQSADFAILRDLSTNTKGRFFHASDISDINATFKELNARTVVHSQEDFSSIINIKLIFFMLLLLISTEWFARKYGGGY